jgi:hypothetical protein
VTIASTPAEGYRVASIAVVDGASNPVTVTGNTFVMPTSDATVTVTFEVYDAPDAVIDFETVTGFGGYAPGTSTVSGVSIVIPARAGHTAAATASGRFGRCSIRAPTPVLLHRAPIAQPITKLNFSMRLLLDNTTTFKVQTSPNGRTGRRRSATILPHRLVSRHRSIPAGMTSFQFVTLGGEADRVSIDESASCSVRDLRLTSTKPKAS